eukprot:TRINITY_DN72535_c0_g1_i1.p2 TRINITY_DN72535_c0_g1~~TRINITY_DN72535_c0_g1_i1.p2  ORF type:complete len:102 (-),score=1.42 TRINITY_DN72535_c0_g1_i1:289-594(-)
MAAHFDPSQAHMSPMVAPAYGQLGSLSHPILSSSACVAVPANPSQPSGSFVPAWMQDYPNQHVNLASFESVARKQPPKSFFSPRGAKHNKIGHARGRKGSL